MKISLPTFPFIDLSVFSYVKIKFAYLLCEINQVFFLREGKIQNYVDLYVILSILKCFERVLVFLENLHQLFVTILLGTLYLVKIIKAYLKRLNMKY